MSDEIKNKAEDGDHVNENETKDKEQKHRSVSFNKDVHVKRFGKPRESRGASSEPPVIRKEPFTHLSEQELINEANKVLAQAHSVTCTTDQPPEKFFSLPHRRKFKEERSRRNSDDGGSPDNKRKSPLGRSTSDVSSKKRKERTSLSTIFRRAQRNKSPDAAPVIVTTKPVAVVKRSKSDVSDLKSKNVNINVNTQPKPIRKRSGSESEEFLKSLRNNKTQLSPIIESSPREDYFQKISPLDIHEQENKRKANSKPEVKKTIDNKKVNPVEKPPRYKTTEKLDPKPPSRTRRGKSTEKERDKKEKSPVVEPLLEKKVLIDKHDCGIRDNKPLETKSRIKESIRKIEENIYGDKDMIHSSQQPPDKPPLTRGHTVDPIVRILKEDQTSPPPKSHLISPTNGNNVNQPFSYIKPSVSPDPNLFARNASPERVPSPVNKMDKGAVYAQVTRGRGGNGLKHNIHKETSPFRDKYANFSDEDEGLGYEERYKYAKNDYEYKKNTGFDSIDGYKITDSPIKPKYREYKLTTNFKDLEPTYANEYPSKEDITRDYIDTFRGRADGMDTIRKLESEMLKDDLDFNELSHRRQMLESRLNARKVERERNVGEPISRYLAETDPIYEAQKRMKATEKYVNEITSKYYRHTLERDGFAESTVTEDYSKYDSDNNRVKYNTEMRTVKKLPNGDFIDSLEKPRYSEDRKVFPPEPEYEPPSLEFNASKSKLTPDEYKEKKYRVKKHFTSSQDALQTGQKYKKDSWFGKRKGHYASNPEIAHEREDDYANIPYHARHPESYHNSLRRKSKDRYYKDDFAIKRHDSGDSRDYYRENRTRKFEIDNRLVDSGIENDFRKDSNVDIHKRYRHDSYDDVRDTSLFLDSERKHTEDNYPNEQIYANGDYLARYEDFNGGRKEYEYKKFDEDSHLDPKMERYDISPSHRDDKISAKPPKAKKLSGLDRVKQLFSRDSSKKSKKEKDIVQPRSRTRVLKSPEHLANDDPEYRRYTDPEPSDIEARKREYETKAEDRRYKSSREDLRHRTPDTREAERKYREYDGRYDRTLKEEKRHHERHEKRRYHSSDRESEALRPSDMESELRKTRSRTAGPMDSPGLAERYRERRRLATPSPSPSPPRREQSRPATSSWFKSLDRIGRKRDKNQKMEKESILTTEDESTRKTYKPTKPLNSPAKNLRFFGDTDQDSDATTVKNAVTKTRSHPIQKSHGTLRKTTSNSSTGIDEVDHQELSSKSYSLSNLNRREEKSESPRTKQYYKRNLHNISEIQSNSETESHLGRKVSMKPPISPYERQSRSQSSSKTLKGKSDVKRRTEDRSGSELRGSKQEINRDVKSSSRRRTPAPNSGESSTEGDSSHQSQRSVVYLHATTVGDIPDPGVMSRNRSRDDISSINSSNFQVKQTTKTFSLFAPWTPKHYGEQHDLHYAQKPRKSKSKDKTPIKSLNDERPGTLQKKKSYSQTTLSRRPQNNRLTSSSTTLHRKPEKRLENSSRKRETSHSSEIERNDDRIARSISMPKDNSKKAGWFNLSNKNKKQEINTRVR